MESERNKRTAEFSEELSKRRRGLDGTARSESVDSPSVYPSLSPDSHHSFDIVASSGSATSLLSNFFPLRLVAPQLFQYAVFFESQEGIVTVSSQPSSSSSSSSPSSSSDSASDERKVSVDFLAERKSEWSKYKPLIRQIFGFHYFDGTNLLALDRIQGEAMFEYPNKTVIATDNNKAATVHQKDEKKISNAGRIITGSSRDDELSLEYKESDASFGRIRVTLVKIFDNSGESGVEVQMVSSILIKQIVERHLKLVRIIDSYFDPKKLIDIGIRGFHLMRGFSFRIASTSCGGRPGVAIVVDVIHKALQDDTLCDAINRKGGRQIDSHDRSSLEEDVAGRMVLTRHTRMFMKVDGIDWSLSPDSTFFDRRTNGMISYREYYRNQYQIDLKQDFPGMIRHVPRRNVNQRDSFNSANGRRGRGAPIFFPPELCQLTGLTEHDRENFHIMKAVASESRKRPADRKRMIEDFVNNIARNTSSSNTVPLVSLSSSMTECSGRVIEGPTLTVSRNGRLDRVRLGRTDNTNRAVSGGVKGVHLLRSDGSPFDERFSRLIILTEKENERHAENLIRMIASSANRYGMEWRSNARIEIVERSHDRNPCKEWERTIRKICREAPAPRFFVALLSKSNNKIVYSCIKTLSIYYGVVSSCIQASTMADQKRCAGAVALFFVQLMVKLGARLWMIEPANSIGSILRQSVSEALSTAALPSLPSASISAYSQSAAPRTMICAADVCYGKKIKGAYRGHWSENGPRGDEDKHAVAFLSSYDHCCSAFAAQVTFQPPSMKRGWDLIIESDILMKNAIENFKTKNDGAIPSHIILFRDGTGDSQIQSFIIKEIELYKKAFAEYQPPPKLTLILVQKSTGVRLFRGEDSYASSSSSRGGAMHNSVEAPKPGTVIDRTIVAPHRQGCEFYLVACMTPPGANPIPTRYIVVQNECELSADEVELLCYHQTFSHQNWQGSIKVPVPIFLADSLAYLVGRFCHLKDTRLSSFLKEKIFYI